MYNPLIKFIGIIVVGLTLIKCSSGGMGGDFLEPPVFRDSLHAFNFYVDNYPENKEPLFYRSKFFIRNGNVAGANNDIRKALELDSTDLRFRNTYASIQLSMLNLEEVKYHYEYTLAQEPHNIDALMGMAKLYALLSNFPMAQHRYLDTVISINPYYADAYFLRGIIYRTEYELSGNPESLRRSLSNFQTTVEQNPEYYGAYIEMGVVFDNLDSTIALDYYNSALEISPKSTEALYNKGMYFQKRGYVDSALSQYHKILTIDSSFTNAYYNQGYIHLIMTGVLDSARFYFEESIKREPDHYRAYNNLGLTYEKLGEKETAIKNYKKAIDIYPDFKLAKENLNALQ